MPNIEIDKWPPLLQAAAVIGALLAGLGSWLWGSRSKAVHHHADDVELEALRERNAALQAQLDDNKLREDLAKVVEAARTALEHEIQRKARELSQDVGEIDKRLRDVELRVAEMTGGAAKG